MTNKNHLISFLFLLCTIISTHGTAQNSVDLNIVWNKTIIEEDPFNGKQLEIWECDDCQLYHKHPETPFFVKRLKINEHSQVSVNITDIESTVVVLTDSRSEEYIQNDFVVHHWVSQERNNFYLTIKILPFRTTISGIEQLEKAKLNISLRPDPLPVRRDPTTTLSKLTNGQIYKIAIPTEGVYEIDSEFLSDLGLDLASLDPRKIQLLGNEGGKLAQSLENDPVDDLAEIAIQVTGQEDGSFDSADKIRFYAEGPNKLRPEGDSYIFEKNIYDLNNYVFLKVANENGQRLESQTSIPDPSYTFSDYDYILRLEDDLVNLLGDYNLTQGSGQGWYGDRFKTTRSKNYSTQLTIPNIIPGEAKLQVQMAARSGSSSIATVSIDGQDFNINFPSSVIQNVESPFAKRRGFTNDIELSNGNPNFTISYPETGTTSEAWLDYIQIDARRSLSMIGEQMSFSDKNSGDAVKVAFTLSNASDASIWDVTDLSQNKILVSGSNSNTVNYGFNTQGAIRKFIAFKSFLSPVAIGQVDNQNIHEISDVELVVIYHNDFKEAAEQFMQHRTNVNPLNCVMVNIDEVYNEFSSGRVDPSAIRNFAKMIYDRTDNFKYLLLLGDGSYDHRNIMPEVPNGNFIPTYQTKETLQPIEAFPSDDYFALLNDQEGSNLKGELDIAVGRIPVKTAQEANAVINKIIHYETNPATLGDWRLNLMFNADDEDSLTHLQQADGIAKSVEQNNPVFNQRKNYWDSYVQVSTPGGDRYPDATDALNKAIQSGNLLTNYLGHGGSNGWSQERVLKVTDIQNFQNFDRLTTFVTATCSFTGYDDPGRITAGELCLTNPNGGAVSLLTTTRAVYISGNKRLTAAVYDTIFTKVDGENIRLGEIMRRAKNSNAQDTFGTNARKFALIGDPSLKLAIPEFNIVTSSINDVPVTANSIDTIGALQRVKINGFVANFDGSIKTDFNGIVYPTIFDKKSTIQTLGNDGANRVNFEVLKNILFKGAATVSNGEFTFEFIVPMDIDYSYGQGKISYYATDGISQDAAGYYANIIVGGTATDAVSDDQGPQIELFMNNLGFEYGGPTGKSPTLIAKISDDNGINITGNSIGHDLLGVLDDNQGQSFILNEFYAADIDNYTSGTVEYPLSELELGMHKIQVKAWDIANNSAEAITEFVVVDSEDSALKNVLNYPNPFTTKTAFTFTTDLSNASLDILINIYTLSGKLVKTIQTNAISSGGVVSGIEWTGNDDFESNLAKGVYLYKIKARSDQLNSSQESQFEKLVILK